MKRLMVGVVVLAGVLGACSNDETDYKEAAEKFIEDELEKEGIEGAEASCDDPESTDVGTTFSCTASTDAQGDLFFVATISKKDQVSVEGVAELPTDTGTEEEPAEEEEETES
jgi:hypothetical protein